MSDAPFLQYPPPTSGGVPVGGSGTAGTLPIWATATTLGDSAIVQVAGVIRTLALTTAGTGGTNGSYLTQALTTLTGSGSGATADIYVAGNAVTVLGLRAPGSGYAVGDTLSAAITGLTGAVFTVTAITTSDNAAGNVTANRIAAGSSSPTAGISTNAGLVSTTAPLIFSTNAGGTATQFRAGLMANPDNEPSQQTVLTAAEASIPAGIASVARWNMAARTANTSAYAIYGNSSVATQNGSGSGFSYGGVFITTAASATLSGASLNNVGVYSNATVATTVVNANTFTTFYGYDSFLSCINATAQSFTNAGYFVPRVASFTNAAHVVGNFYGVWLPTTNLSGGATITNRYGVYQQDPSATNFWFGKTNFSASATSDTAGNAAAQIIAIQNGGLSYLWMRQRATDTSISIDSYGSAWAEAIRINANNTAGGANTVQLPTAGWGLKLASTPGNTDVNALDCYAEADWTPVDKSGASLAITFTDAKVTRIGRVVHCCFVATYPATASALAAKISLPFPCTSGTPAVPIYPGTAAIGFNSTTAASMIAQVVSDTTNGAYLYFHNPAADVPNSTMSTKAIQVSVTYQIY
jgi:hypothetical protein